MYVEKIEALIKGAGLGFEHTEERRWKLSRAGEQSPPAFLAWLPEPDNDAGLLKIYRAVGKLPPDAGIEFFKDIFRKNRDMGHGAFSLAGNDVVFFVDTLELENCDQNEMDATIAWLLKAEVIFRERLDHSKLPYLDAY